MAVAREADRPGSTPRPALDASLSRLAARREDWVRTGIAERVEQLGRSAAGIHAVAPEWVERACRAKRIDPGSPLAGEEWLSGPMTTLRQIRLLRHALAAGGQPRPASLRPGPGGRRIARVFPADLFDRALYRGLTADVWLRPGAPAEQGRIYREAEAGRPVPGRVGLVLGAGNVASIAPTDVLYKLFVENQVVLLKMNPVNAYLGPLLERAFGGLVEGGFLAFAYGGAEVGDYLCRHECVETIHLTGSDRTHDAIVWGADEAERTRRKAENRARIDKPFTSELGCVTPVVVVPGPWSPGDVAFQARHVAAMVAHNASFNCTAAKVLVAARGWAPGTALLDRVERELARTPRRHPYYPGALERYREFLERYPDARPLGPVAGSTGAVPWTRIPEVPQHAGEYALSREAFCGVLADVALDAGGADAFLERAVAFVNERVWGTLSCVLLVHPATRKRHRPALERAVRDLRYGGIGINVWTGVNFGLGSPSWGAFPGHTPDDVGSGIGVVHNAFLFDHVEKSVVAAPFRMWPKPPWFADHRTLDVLGRRLATFEARPSWGKLPGLAWAAVRG